jgi:hypothetical protein
MFSSRNIPYDSNGIPIFSEARLEAIATELLSKHCPHVLKTPMATPVMGILEELKKRTHLKVQMADLGGQDGNKVLGRVNFPTKTLFLDNSLTGERAVTFQFTAAHEIGHWVLHRYNYQNWKFSSKRTDDLEDDEQSLCRLSNRSPKDWLEYQANTFAAALVMPRQMFFAALVKQQHTQGIRRNLFESALRLPISSSDGLPESAEVWILFA